MPENEGRRPLKVRSSKYSQQFAAWLSRQNISPNQISIFSVVFSLFAAACLIALPDAEGFYSGLLALLAAAFIQLRLLCNLFDGMVAVEGGKTTASGELFNDIPDRIADPVILIAAGFAISDVSWGAYAGWCAGLLAVLTAYIRTLSSSIGAPVDFQGPMAKQHRMAVMTFACLLTLIEPLFLPQGYFLLGALIIIIFGSLLTAYFRTRACYQFLENQHAD